MMNRFKHTPSFYTALNSELDSFLSYQKTRFPLEDTLTMDMHCHDFNSDVPDELIGRILNVPETWLPTEDLLKTLKHHGCNTFTITNHNNARSCYELAKNGIDILTAAEFSVMVPDFQVGIHVLTYGFNEEQEIKLNKLRKNVYNFQEYANAQDIPTIWAHPLYHYTTKVMPPWEFFEKMALVFQRFEIINGQRDTWQNMLSKVWVESLTPEYVKDLQKKHDIDPHRYSRNPYEKSMSGGSDCHMGIFAGLTGTKLYIPNLKDRLKKESSSRLALEAIREGRMAPFGANNHSEKLTIAFLDYFMQIALNSKDPGLLRILLHQGTTQDKIIAFATTNAFAELRRHKVTMSFIELFHDCFTGKKAHFSKRWFVSKEYKPIFDEANKIAKARNGAPDQMSEILNRSIENIFEQLNDILSHRLKKKFESIRIQGKTESKSLNNLITSLELPSHVRELLGGNSVEPVSKKSKKKESNATDISNFLDGLSFPFLASSLILGATFTSAKVMYNNRSLLASFGNKLGKFNHPTRMLWLTDTFEDHNGVSMVLKSMLQEIKSRNLPIDLLVCSESLKPDDHLIVVKPQVELKVPFYEQQPIRMPNLMEIHKIFLEGEYDRVMCSTEGPMGMVALYLKHAYSVPANFYIHTDWIMFARKALNLDKHNLNRLRRLMRAFYGAFDNLFVLNTDQQQWLTGPHMNFEPSRVHLTAHWADDWFIPRSVQKHEVFGCAVNETVVLFAGRLSEEKGVMELPQIYKELKKRKQKVCFVIAGTGPMEKELRKEMPKAKFLGWVDHHKLAEVYSASDVLVLPSKFDTFGCVVLEAMSCGLPVVAYKTKGPKDIIEDGKSGFLVSTRIEMADKVALLVEDNNLQASFKAEAIKRSKNYSSNKIIKQLLSDCGIED